MPQLKLKNNLISVTSNVEEYNFVLSFEGKEIIHNNHANQIIDILARWRYMLGINISNQSENELSTELSFLSKFIKENYNYLTLDEINLAINLSLTNKLEVDTKTYNNFSAFYISQILNAYLTYKRKLYNELSYKLEKNELDYNVEKPSAEDNMKLMKELIIGFYEDYQKDGYINDVFNLVYDFLKKIKKLNFNNLIIEEAILYGEKMAIKEKIHVYGINSKEKIDLELIKKRYSRNYCVQLFFKEIFDINIFLNELKLEMF